MTATLPRYASESHKDPRAPQNLYPVGGLERELRRRLGDPDVLYRALLIAASRGSSARSIPLLMAQAWRPRSLAKGVRRHR